jgi:hypothetical protein
VPHEVEHHLLGAAHREGVRQVQDADRPGRHAGGCDR